MAKLSALGNEDTPVKVVEISLTNARVKQDVMLTLLNASERLLVLQRAKSQFGGKWDDTDPECILNQWIETVAMSAKDPDSPSEPWATSEELRNSRNIGQENIQYLFEAYEAFEEDMSIRSSSITRTEALLYCFRLAEGDDSPLDVMRLGTLRAFAHFTGSLLWNLVKDRDISSLGGSSNIESIGTSSKPKPQRTPQQGADGKGDAKPKKKTSRRKKR